MKRILCLLGIILLITGGVLGYVVYEENLQEQRLNRLLQAYPEAEEGIIALYFRDVIASSSVNRKDEEINDSAAISEHRAISEIIEKYGYTNRRLTNHKTVWLLWFFLVVILIIFFLAIWRIEDRRELMRERNYEKLFFLLCERVKNIQEQEKSVKPGKYTEQKEFVNLQKVIKQEIDSIEPARVQKIYRDKMGYTGISNQWDAVEAAIDELENRLALQRERYAEEENNTKSLITDLSHQLKTPLASLAMSHELMLSDNLTEQERKEFMEQETVEIHKLEQLLEELVKVSRLEHHMIHITPVKQSIKATIADAVSQVYGKAKGHGTEIKVDIEEDYTVSHDRKWTTEAIENVLDNAIKYSPDHAVVEVRVKELTSNILIEVKDCGIGIAKSEYHRIFQRFYRGKEAAAKEKDGAGVGLYLARMIIEEQMGTITVKNEIGRGSVFQILLPIEYNKK